ncbi:anti-sigma-D factor RsdA [Mycolicibacterium hodleri]|uniref:Anti-sigma-D factor RsdA sigma factor binding region domain-containing protein n=1 Tax=Mycolicibacterium hodleri TaxID=49897 RepID=A0A502ED79_9MYCO|nr:anti-sigma-D factor RsdA [Mycolicibacterium hodleri]TPG34420.1 hypothetical protein EAH80_12730 [Mycolicibacterium hodleri]
MPDFGRWNASGGDPSLNEINRADRFFESLAAKQPVYSTDPEEAELAFLMSGWRDDVRDAPVTAPVTPRDAVEALHSGLAKDRRPRRSLAVVGSVAAAMLCIGGFGTAVYGAGPGDALYGMRTSLFGQQEATRNDQVSLASAQLAQVQQLIDNGQWQEAQDKLVAVSTTVQDVGQTEQKQQLVEQWNALTYKVVQQDSAATLAPGEPLPVLPSSPLTWMPVPVIEASTSESTSESTSTSVSSTTESSDSSEAVPTSPSEGPTGSPTSSSAPAPASLTPPGSALPPTASSPPSTSAVASVPPSTTATTTTPTTTAATTTTTTTTTTPTTAPREAEATQQASTSVAPPVVRSTSTAIAPPPASAPASAPASVSAESSRPATSTAPAERPSTEPVTTTLFPPAKG